MPLIFRALLLISLLGLQLTAQAETSLYMEGAFGLGVQSLENEDDSDEADSTASKVLKLGAGVQLLPFLSGGLAMYSWGIAQDNNKEDAINFEGLSAGWELIAHLPFSLEGLPPGPYIRYGGHCWAATITGLAQPWAKDGCSDLAAIGFAFSSSGRRPGNASAYVEFSRTHFDDVTSGSIIAGIRNRF